MSTRIAVIGVGNDFRRDDGAGWAVVSLLRDRIRGPGTTLATCDGDPARLIALWNGADLAVVVDAAHAHPSNPGRVHRIALSDGALAGGGATSSHGLGLGEAVELARVLHRLPHRLVVYAVEGADDALGTGLSAPVAAAVGPLAEVIATEVEGYGQARGYGHTGGGYEQPGGYGQADDAG